MDILLNERQTAEQMNLSVRTLQRLRSTGNGPLYLKVGRLVRYRAEAVSNYLAACVRTSTSDTGTST